MVQRWEHWPHAADIGIRGWGASPAEAFEQAARALTAAVTGRRVREVEMVETSCSAPDLEMLFVAWLNAVIYEMDVRKMLFSKFAVRIDGEQLHARMWGEPADMLRHAPECEPKGATYAELKVARQDGEWFASCVIDV